MRLLIALVVSLLPAYGAVSNNDLAQHADAYVNARFNEGHFMGSVLVARDGKILFEKSYGWADAEWNVPNTPTTKFRLGSITKQFTSVCILQLQEAGKLKISDPVSKYYTDAPAAWSKVTIHHLLTHTSGIPSYTEIPDFFSKHSMSPLTPAEIIKLTQDKPLLFEPGAQFKYNNTGYIVLGYIVEKVSGMPYKEYLRKHVLDPLGMKDTGYDTAEDLLPQRASGYTGDVKHLKNAPYLDMTLPYAAGSLYSTVEDLLKWDQALYTDKLLSKASFDQIYTPALNHYAFGWEVDEQDTHKRYAHGGGINGFNTFIARYPQDRTLVVVLSNLNSQLPGAIAADLARLSWGEPVKPPAEHKTVKVSTEILDRYVGKYDASPTIVLVITRDGDHLVVTPEHQGPAPLAAESETHFYVAAVDAAFDFDKDAKGQVTGLTLHQGGQDIKAKRVP